MNEYGLDVNYFKNKLSLLVRDIDCYKPEELYRELSRLANVVASQAQQPPKMQFLDRSKEKIITLLWQGICDGTVEAFDVNGMMVIPSEEGMTYVRKEDAISFFGLVEPSQAQQESRDWKEDYADGENMYQCTCSICESKFYGYKRRVVCKVCDASQAQQPEYTFDQLTKMMMQAATKEGHKVTMKIKWAQPPAPEGGEQCE